MTKNVLSSDWSPPWEDFGISAKTWAAAIVEMESWDRRFDTANTMLNNILVILDVHVKLKGWERDNN